MKLIGHIKGEPHEFEATEIAPGVYLKEDAAKAYLAMKQAAKADKIDLVANSGFRSMAKQTKLYAAYIEKLAQYQEKQLTKRPAIVARPGYSNHQGGIAVDINRAPGDNLATSVPDSPIDLWLNANAARFGFKRTVKSEPWHWEYRPAEINA